MQPLDAIDRQIIAALRIDARKPVSRLASELGIARATAEKRLARMIDSGTILGFTVRARDDTPATVRAVMLIEVAGRSTAAVIRGLKGLPELERLHTTNGGWDLVAEIKAANLADFDRVLREVRSIDGVLNSETSLLLSSV
ncbi:Lrp/AsnC family transcriptional regulator [Sphingopyxis panaciterrulae]|jgi:DNA-binding Lrp family transcriptional regulator|uniref:DNA-binding Lrp family transcriptional regulator n=1 Tax=Sphingopyxis panaciterrulae TaxID=462372 RepID=A0A7W9B4P9_9SPHN|nr:Lrp/AsnC family transcriptional regulator [Sphingopyxis panaciterrulae]MBB5705922.1 DNA-binding Lrp family transcriptional regulator [Sphingopyxis panaciterrulae]